MPGGRRGVWGEQVKSRGPQRKIPGMCIWERPPGLHLDKGTQQVRRNTACFLLKEIEKMIIFEVCFFLRAAKKPFSKFHLDLFFFFYVQLSPGIPVF